MTPSKNTFKLLNYVYIVQRDSTSESECVQMPRYIDAQFISCVFVFLNVKFEKKKQRCRD